MNAAYEQQQAALQRTRLYLLRECGVRFVLDTGLAELDGDHHAQELLLACCIHRGFGKARCLVDRLRLRLRRRRNGRRALPE